MKTQPGKALLIIRYNINVGFGAPSVYKDFERQGKMYMVHMLENQNVKPFLMLQIDSGERRKSQSLIFLQLSLEILFKKKCFQFTNLNTIRPLSLDVCNY